MNEDREKNLALEFDPFVVDWMQKHTIGDLKRIARGIEEAGEDADDIWKFIDELLPFAKAIFTKEHAIENRSIEELNFEDAILATP